MSFENPGPVEENWRDAISSVQEIIEDARNGRMFILVDHEDRENEGDLVIPAQMATPEAINFMATHGRGLICLTLPGERIEGGVLVRAGHTEAAVDVSRLAGLNASGVICEIMNEDGTMSRLPELVAFAQKHGLKIGTISDLIAYRRRHDNLVKVRSEETITSEFGGEWTMRIYTDETQGAEHIVLMKGDLSGDTPVLTRMHTMDPMLDVVGTGPKGRAAEFSEAMRLVAQEGRGVVVLLRDTAMKLDTDDEVSPQTLRRYGLGAQILSSLGLGKLELLTNSPTPKVVGLEAYGLEITGTRKISELG